VNGYSTIYPNFMREHTSQFSWDLSVVKDRFFFYASVEGEIIMVFLGFVVSSLIIFFICIQNFNFTQDILDSSAEVYFADLHQGGHLKIKINIESEDEKLQEKIKFQQGEIRDTILSIVVDKSKEELQGPYNLYNLKRSLIKELNNLFNEDNRYKIFIPEVLLIEDGINNQGSRFFI